MEGWRLPGAARNGIGFGSGLQPDDSWFGDAMATSSSLPPQFAAQKRCAPAGSSAFPSKAARHAADPSGRLILEEPRSFAGGLGGAMRGATASHSAPFSAAEEDPAMPSAGSTTGKAHCTQQQVPCSALKAGRLSFDDVVPAPPGFDVNDTFASEVYRITGIGTSDYKCIFDLQPSEWNDLNLIQSKYRHLMRLLHPDKRRKDEEVRAGGRDRCDRAVRLVQEALSKAKKEAQPDPDQELKNEMRRMQEMQRQRARMAQQREAPTPREAAPAAPDLDSLLSDISQVLGTAAPAATAAAPPSSSNTTSELMDLLASMRKTDRKSVV